MTGWQLTPGWGFVDRPEEIEHGGRLYAAHLLTGEIAILQGATAVVARSALAGGDVVRVREHAAREFGVRPEDVDPEVLAEVISELGALGLLTQSAG